ncbi:MAG: hypothetical protein WCR06_11690, partial [bacterium]
RRSFIAPDGLVSIRRSFTIPEVHALLRAAAPVHPVCVRSLPPGRLVIEGGRACPCGQATTGLFLNPGRL